MALKKINYNGQSKIILRLCEMVNQLIDGGGGGGSTVTYTQTLSSGTKTGEISIDGVSTDMYAPTQPTALSDLTNDEGFIDNTVNNLTNYYLKFETYTQAEVDALISAIVTLNILVVQTLPTQDISTTTIYLVPKQTAETQDIYDEYIYVNNAWELIGTTQIDLSNYYTKTQVDNLLSAKVSDNPTFTEASTRANIASGESFATILGKIKKFFTDLKAVAFSGSYNDLDDTPTISTDFVSKANGGTFNGRVYVDEQNGGADQGDAWSAVVLGNNIAKGTVKHSAGRVRFFSNGSNHTDLQAPNATENRAIELPDKAGTIALTSDIYEEETLTVSDVITPASGITFDSNSTIIKKNGRIYARLYGTGSITTSANGAFSFGTVKSAYRPTISQTCAVSINSATSGHIYDVAVCQIGETGGLGLRTGKINTQFGNTSYPWTTLSGLMISWAL